MGQLGRRAQAALAPTAQHQQGQTAEGKLLLFCCNKSHEIFMTYQPKPKAGGMTGTE